MAFETDDPKEFLRHMASSPPTPSRLPEPVADAVRWLNEAGRSLVADQLANWVKDTIRKDAAPFGENADGKSTPDVPVTRVAAAPLASRVDAVIEKSDLVIDIAHPIIALARQLEREVEQQTCFKYEANKRADLTTAASESDTRIYTKEDAERLCEIAVAAAIKNTRETVAASSATPEHVTGTADKHVRGLLHILRNPHGFTENEIRAARLAAADMIERMDHSATNATEAAKNELVEAAKGWLIAYEEEVRNPDETEPCKRLVAAVDAILRSTDSADKV